MKHPEASFNESELLCELSQQISNASALVADLRHARALLDSLESCARRQRAHAQLVTIHAAQDLTRHLEDLERQLPSAFGFAFLRTYRRIKAARRQLGTWLARVSMNLSGTRSVPG
jgi:hypothetical protein